MVEPSQPVLSLAALRRALSPERLAAYALPEDRDDLDSDPSLLYEKEARAVAEAKATLRRGGRPLTIGRLLSKLSLGFWVGLCRSPYEQGRPSGPALWPAAIPIAFPFLPRDHRNRPAILQRLDEIRELRNRTFHHEAIWDRNLPRSHRRIVDTLGWMNQGLARAVRHLSRLDATYEGGLQGFRGEAERIARP